MAKAKTTEISTADSFAAFEQLLITQQTVNEEIAAAEGNPVAVQVAKAKGLVTLREAFTDAAMPAVMQLAGTSVGFRTDKDIDGGGTEYSPLVVRDAVLAALMDGVELMGNKLNIIAKRYYCTTEGFDHKLASLPQLSDIDIQVGNPEDIDIQETPSNNGNYTVFTVYGFVPVVINCRIHGEPYRQVSVQLKEIDGRFLVSASGKDKLKTVDSLKSKAEKRAKERLYDYALSATQPPEQPALQKVDSAPVTREAETESTTQTRDWASEFKNHDIVDLAKLIRDAPGKDERDAGVRFANKKREAGEITNDAFDLIVEYAGSKN